VRGVEHHHIYAAGKRSLVALHVGFDRRLGKQRTLTSLDRNVDRHKVRNRLRLAVFEDLKVFLLQIADVVATRIGDDGVDLDEVDLHLEGRRLRGWRACRRLTGRRLTGTKRRSGQQHDEDGKTDLSTHARIMPQ
jgi:hypothetical protein